MEYDNLLYMTSMEHDIILHLASAEYDIIKEYYKIASDRKQLETLGYFVFLNIYNCKRVVRTLIFTSVLWQQ